jgi:glycosyltransferase involved in cell wall biosynthesis
MSLIVPVYNSAGTLDELQRSIRTCASFCAQDFEVIYVDDCSTDGSLDVLRGIESHDEWVRVIRHDRNRGQAQALLTGIVAARSDIVVTLDDDLQHKPSDITRLLAVLENSDQDTLVMGVAPSIKRPLWRGVVSICANAVSNRFLAKPLPMQLTTFCAFHKQLCLGFQAAGDRDLALITALVQHAASTLTVPLQADTSIRRESRYGFRSLFRLFLARSPYFQLSKVLKWNFAAVLLLSGTTALSIFNDRANHRFVQLLLLVAIAICSALSFLAFKVSRQTSRPMV